MSMNALTSFGLRRARSRKTHWPPSDLVRATQLEHFLAQLLDLLALLAGREIRPQATIRLRLAHAPSQHLVMDPEIDSDVPNRTARLDRQPDPALDQLLWILPSSWHHSRFS
jgi:hypothetical protein